VAAVADTANAGASTGARQPVFTLNEDGQRHPVENTLTVITFVAGIIAFAVGWVVKLHLPALVLGLVSMVIGMYTQLISSTRSQRIVIVSGMVAAFVGGALAVAHGGFS
jgi:membrane associated rhomboid family serine protease